MTFRRFRRSQPVATAAVAFTDSTDSHVEPYSIAGEASFPSTRSVPRDGVRRLLWVDLVESVPFHTVPGYGAGQPHVSPYVRRRLPGVGATGQARRAFTPPRLLQAQRRIDWHAFQQLRVRVPARVRFCVQRHQRKQVLFALKVAGRRGSAPGPYRRREEFNWRC